MVVKLPEEKLPEVKPPPTIMVPTTLAITTMVQDQENSVAQSMGWILWLTTDIIMHIKEAVVTYIVISTLIVTTTTHQTILPIQSLTTTAHLIITLVNID